MNKNFKGGMLVNVLFAFVVISIFSAGLMYLFRNNMQMAVFQERRQQAYFAAFSGVELAWGALYTDEDINGISITPLITQFQDSGANAITTTTFVGAATVYITIERRDGEIPGPNAGDPPIPIPWVQITSVANITQGQGSNVRTFTSTVIKRVDPSERGTFEYEVR